MSDVDVRVGDTWRGVLGNYVVTGRSAGRVNAWAATSGDRKLDVAFTDAEAANGSVVLISRAETPATPAPWRVGQRRRGRIVGSKCCEKQAAEFSVEHVRRNGGSDKVVCAHGKYWYFMADWPNELVADAPGETPVDWAKWLPPRPLPDTGPKEFKAGQVWAARTTGADIGTVRRVVSGRNDMGADYATVETLAGGECDFLAGSSLNAKHAILVQDVGEPRPRDPAVLYGASPASAPAPGRQGGKVPASPALTAVEISHLASTQFSYVVAGFSPYNRKPTGVSEADLEALAAGPWRKR